MAKATAFFRYVCKMVNWPHLLAPMTLATTLAGAGLMHVDGLLLTPEAQLTVGLIAVPSLIAPPLGQKDSEEMYLVKAQEQPTQTLTLEQ